MMIEVLRFSDLPSAMESRFRFWITTPPTSQERGRPTVR